MPARFAFRPIGVIRSPFKRLADMPIQPTSDAAKPGRVEIYAQYAAGLKDLEGFSHIYLLYQFHKAEVASLLVTPFLDEEPHGIFATRAPTRPNPIGLSLVRIAKIEAKVIQIAALDILDGTPLLDIKPYVPEFEDRQGVRTGWLTRSRVRIRTKRSDSRFQ